MTDRFIQKDWLAIVELLYLYTSRLSVMQSHKSVIESLGVEAISATAAICSREISLLRPSKTWHRNSPRSDVGVWNEFAFSSISAGIACVNWLGNIG
jgi:hypothetical protein